MHIIFDFEVTAYDWLVVFKAVGQDQFYVVHNDNEKLKYFMDIHREDIFFGFNVKHYDRWIMKAILNDADVTRVKEINDYIIVQGNEGYKHPWLSQCRKGYFNFSDLMDDMQVGLSLKSIEAHLGMSIEESTVDFNIDHELTDEELQEMITYCKFDIDATMKLYELRKAYIDNKVYVGMLAGLTEAESLKLTNAKLTAEYLKAEPITTNDERDYHYPDNLLKEFIPDDVFTFFNRLQDNELSDDEVFKTQYKGNIGNCSYTLGFGGIHGDCGNIIIDSTNDKVAGTNDEIEIINEDVGSYYPHLITINGYCSRAIRNAKDYELMLEQRMKAKASGDKVTANALKLVCNSTYGAFGDKYNKLYDPKMMRSVCISGQLYLLELAYHCHTVPTCELIQLNTDGIMLSVGKSHLNEIIEICREWQDRTHFDLERDDITKVIQKDVNNYIEIKADGSYKCKGGYLVRGVSAAGAFNVNNNFSIVSKAVVDYFTKGITPEQTIGECDDIMQFQIIAKAGSKYKGAVQEIDGVMTPVQNCNRVYATADARFGTLYKIHKQTGKPSKIANLPLHCLVDNKNQLSITDVDKKWYIKLAWKYIKDYIGDEKMATATKKVSIYEKLMLARIQFGMTEKKKSGVNAHAEFKYYELQDIVPIATKVFNDLGLAFYTSFEGENVLGYLIDTDSSESITFKVPFATISEPGKFRQNEIQAMGGAITYFRRYMYMLVLDIVEPDAFDGGDFGAKETAKNDAPKEYIPKETAAPKKPVTKEKRAEIKEELVSADAPADNDHIIALKTVLKNLRKIDVKYEEEIQAVVTETNGFKNLTNTQAEELIKKYGKIVQENTK